MQEFISFAASHGLTIPSPILDGKIHRLKPDGHNKETGWYIGWINEAKSSGKSYEMGKVGDWRKGPEGHLYRPNIPLTKTDQAQIDRQIKASQQLVNEERARIQEEVSKEAVEAFATFSSLATSPYLTRKKIGGLFGAKVFKERDQPVLAIPMADINGKIWGYQKIYADGGKWYLEGQRCKELFHLIGSFEKDKPVYICEGYATGASIHMATKEAVFCAFSAGNIPFIAALLRKKHMSLKIVVCADDDRFTESGNAGMKYAEKAAKESECSIINPRFRNENSRGTDFNDLHVEEGLEEVTNQIKKVNKIRPSSYIPLGFDGTTHFFYSTTKADIIPMHKFGGVEFLNLMPKEHWIAQFPPMKNARTPADWPSATDFLLRISEKIGAFDPRRVRGTGATLDRGRFIINTGRGLIVDGKKTVMQDIETRHVYIQTRNKMPDLHLSPLTAEEARQLVTVITEFRWSEKKSGYLLAGWLAIARIAGALPIRPHIWITGGADTGKSSLMRSIIAPALGAPGGKLYFQGGTTEAGIRQSIKADSLPVIFDEFETTGATTAERLASIIELMRQSWSHTEGEIVKGSASGLAQQYSLSFAALVSSIRISLDNDADHSRFCVLGLDKHNSDPEEWKKIVTLMKNITEEFGERLFARSAKLNDKIRENFKSFRDAVIRVTKNSRSGDQYGMLLAGYFSLISDGLATDEECDDLVKTVDLVGSADKLKDEEELLNHIRTTVIEAVEEPIPGTAIKRNMTIAQLIENKHCPIALLNYGIKLSDDGKTVMIANHHAELRKKLANTKWAKNWNLSLLRLPGAKPNGTLRFREDGSCAAPTKAVSIPTEIFLKDL